MRFTRSRIAAFLIALSAPLAACSSAPQVSATELSCTDSTGGFTASYTLTSDSDAMVVPSFTVNGVPVPDTFPEIPVTAHTPQHQNNSTTKYVPDNEQLNADCQIALDVK